MARPTARCRAVQGLALAVALLGQMALGAAATPDWDKVANVKSAARQIGEIQRSRGVEAAYKFISACYKTHGLASKYSKAFEGCIAQDYLQSRALALVYERLPADRLKSMGAPTANEVIVSLQKRLGAAFAQYKITAGDGEAFLKLVDRHGMPAFMALVFPNAENPKDRQ